MVLWPMRVVGVLVGAILLLIVVIAPIVAIASDRRPADGPPRAIARS